MAPSEPSTVVGLDTSVVVRLLAGEPPAQAERALSFLDELRGRGGTPIVSDLVVAESYFALHAHYGVPKREAVRALLDLLESGWASPEPNGSAMEVLRAMVTASQSPGFADRLIHAQYVQAAARVVSFERAFRKLEGTIVLRA